MIASFLVGMKIGLQKVGKEKQLQDNKHHK
jgi:hypothetical protein